jgi:uncharacterized protein (DUF433 family)
VITAYGRWEEPPGTLLLPETLNLLAPFATTHATGPDLRAPRERIRIVPGKLGGAPHIARTRIETEAIAALAARGIARSDIEELYPEAEPEAISDAIDLERQLTANTKVAG